MQADISQITVRVKLENQQYQLEIQDKYKITEVDFGAHEYITLRAHDIHRPTVKNWDNYVQYNQCAAMMSRNNEKN